MPLTTAGNCQLNFPTAIWAKLALTERPTREDVMDALHETQRIHIAAQTLSNRVIELEAQVLRLTHENEFMLRLVNERDSA